MLNTCAEIKIEDLDPFVAQLAALKNKNRWTMMQILRSNEKSKVFNEYHNIYYYSMSANDINKHLKKKGIAITTPCVREHLNVLRSAGLIDRIKIDIDENGVHIPNTVYGYYIKEYAFDDLFLKLNILRDQINPHVDLYKKNDESKKYNDCVLTVFNGVDKGKQLALKEGEVALIGRMSTEGHINLDPLSIVLSNSYNRVSSIDKPHLMVYCRRGVWYIKDKKSSNGTYCSNNELERNKEYKLPNNSLIELSKGPGSALLYCSYN